MTQYMDAAGLHSAGGVGSRLGMGAGVFPDERVLRGVWPLVGRDAETDRVKEVLLDANASGVLIVGAAGQGKTAVARHAVNTLPGEAEVLYIRGSSIGAGVPYSALTVLLVDLDERVARHPLVLLTALQALFGRMPGSRPIVVVDNVEDLDPQSAAVLAHLASVESVRLVVITEQLQRTPEPFVELWRNQALERIDVEPLTLEQTRELLEEVLGAAVSRALVVALWTDSGGKAGNLRAMIPLARDSGQAEYREGIWTQRWLPPEDDVADSRMGANSLDATSGDARKTIALLCILGTLPLPMLLRHVSQVEVDGLQQDGLVRVLWNEGPTVTIDDPVAGATFRAALARVPEPAVTEALDEIEREDLPPASDIVLTAWLMQAGAPITGTRLLRSARYANQLALPHLVRPFLAHLGSWQEHPDAVIEYARLALDRSEADTARSAIDTLLQAPDLQPAARAALRLADVRIRMRQAPAGEWLPTALVDCEADCSAVPGADGEHLRAELALLRLELSLLDGHYLQVARSSSDLLTSTLDYSSTAIRTKGMLMLALAATGQHERADVLGQVLARSPHTASSPRDRAEAHRSSVLALALAGRLDEALGRLRDVSSSHRDVQDEAWAESMAGLLLAGSGRSRDALPLLLPAMAQLRMEDRFGLLPATEAAAAYAYALDGQDEAARGYLDRVRQPERHRGWVSRRTTEYFTVLTASLLDEPGNGGQVMLRAADRELARGNRGIELVLLAQAVRLGEHSAAHRLSVRSSELGSPLAGSSLLLSKGVLAQDPALLLEAAEAALIIGHHDLAGSSALLAVELRAQHDDPLIFVRAEQILRQTSVERRRSLTRQALTERERAVARMVARGASNKDIAAAEHWSIRTAEGYVHRAMSKLGVHNRKQLRSVFAKR